MIAPMNVMMTAIAIAVKVYEKTQFLKKSQRFVFLI